MANIPPTAETLNCYDYSCEIAKTGAATCTGAGYNGGKCWGGRFCGDGSPIIGRAPINAGRIKFVISHTPTDAFGYPSVYSKHIRCVTQADVRAAVQRYGDEFPDRLFRNHFCGKQSLARPISDDLRARTTVALMAILSGTPLTEDQLSLDGFVRMPPATPAAAKKKRKAPEARSGTKKRAKGAKKEGDWKLCEVM